MGVYGEALLTLCHFFKNCFEGSGELLPLLHCNSRELTGNQRGERRGITCNKSSLAGLEPGKLQLHGQPLGHQDRKISANIKDVVHTAAQTHGKTGVMNDREVDQTQSVFV